MPRQLPWKVNAASKPAPAPRSRTTESPSLPTAADRTGTRSLSRPKSGTSTPVGGKPRRSLTARPDRSPSTSPPPEPISEDFMIEGFDNDDRYRMVEDEFLSMANDFTKHLHAAEYQRLKAIANTRNAEMIRTISRPVTGRMTDLVKRRRGAAELAASQRKGLKNALGKRKGRQDDSDSDESDGELPWAGTSLQGLMESPRKVHVPLPVGSSSLGHGERPSTARQTTAGPSGVSDFASRVGIRASKAHVETTTDEDEDDLDAQPRYVARTNTVNGSRSSTLALNQKVASIEAMSRRREPTFPPARSEPARSVFPREAEEKRAPAPSRDTANDPDDDDDDDDDDFQARIRKRRAEQRRRREEEDKKRKQNGAVDAIPLF
ncbi:hypothetical protein GE09DRAFT_1215948 [Coniochaeta sp. 2T2.1]|nr:hypothetical protein GE09DRAFT_1215948 [Coniochaeta sp. 2T2.1]